MISHSHKKNHLYNKSFTIYRSKQRLLQQGNLKRKQQICAAVEALDTAAHHKHPLEETTVRERTFLTEVLMRSCFTSCDTIILPYIVVTCIDP
jgi:hypothetical protein